MKRISKTRVGQSTKLQSSKSCKKIAFAQTPLTKSSKTLKGCFSEGEIENRKRNRNRDTEETFKLMQQWEVHWKEFCLLIDQKLNGDSKASRNTRNKAENTPTKNEKDVKTTKGSNSKHKAKIDGKVHLAQSSLSLSNPTKKWTSLWKGGVKLDKLELGKCLVAISKNKKSRNVR